MDTGIILHLLIFPSYNFCLFYFNPVAISENWDLPARKERKREREKERKREREKERKREREKERKREREREREREKERDNEREREIFLGQNINYKTRKEKNYICYFSLNQTLFRSTITKLSVQPIICWDRLSLDRRKTIPKQLPQPPEITPLYKFVFLY